MVQSSIGLCILVSCFSSYSVARNVGCSITVDVSHAPVCILYCLNFANGVCIFTGFFSILYAFGVFC